MKGIPIPKDLALPSNLSKGPVENLESHPKAVARPSTRAPLNSAPVPNSGSPTGPDNVAGPENESTIAPGPEKAPGAGYGSKEATGWSCAGVNYDLQCEV